MSRPAARSERGAMLVMVAIALVGLLAFSALVIDYGILWASRVQAQNAADAGAHAAAVNLLNDPTNTAGAVAAAKRVANENGVWNQAPASVDVLVQTGITCPPGSGGGPGCVRVDVMRGGTDRNGTIHTNTLPTVFANMVGVTSQAINATAMAQVSAGNAVQCIKPWIVADKWVDGDEPPIGGYSQDDNFNPPTDTYVRPGFTDGSDRGLELVLKEGTVGSWSSGWTQQIEFPGCPGANCYGDEIAGCPSWVPPVAMYDFDAVVPYDCSTKDSIPDPSRGCISVATGMDAGQTKANVNSLVASDAGATWDPNGGLDGRGGVTGGCTSAGTCQSINPTGYNFSPRVVPIAAFHTQNYYTEVTTNACNGTNCVAQVVNLIGFFLEGMCNDVYPNPPTRPSYCGTTAEAKKAVVGRLMKYPGILLTTGGTTTGAFATAVRLVR